MQSAALNIRHGISEAPEIKNLENAIGGAKVEAITVVDAEEVIARGKAKVVATIPSSDVGSRFMMN